MSKSILTIAVSASATLKYWIAIDDRDIEIVNGKSTSDVEDGLEHIIIWWTAGNPGDAISITCKKDNKTIISIKDSKIPEKSYKSAGYRKFKA